MACRLFFEAELRCLVFEGGKNEAVKVYRERTRVGFKKAKEAV